MHGWFGKLAGKYSEEMFFEGDQAWWNPARYIPTPFHTKVAQQRTALSQYIQQEAVGTRMRRWERPIHDFLAPYFRGAVSRLTGENIISGEVEHRRDLDTLTDMLNYLRDLRQAVRDPEHRGRSEHFSSTDHVPSWPRNIYTLARAGEPPPAGPPVRRRGQELPSLQCRSQPLPWFLLLIRSRPRENSSPSGARLSMCSGVPSPC